MVCKTYSLQFATFWNFQHQKSTDFGFRSRCQRIAIILRELLRKRKKPCKECVLASEILYIYFMHRKVTFFLFFCSHLAAEKSTFQRILLVQGSNFRCQLCNRFLKFFRWQRWTTQKTRKTCILTGEILDIYLTCSKLLDFIPFFFSRKNDICNLKFNSKASHLEIQTIPSNSSCKKGMKSSSFEQVR